MDESFSQKLSSPLEITKLFDLLPEAYCFSKDKNGKFTFANCALLEAIGLRKPSELLGKTDYDFFDSALAEEYINEDRLVMKTREPLLDRVWLVPNKDGTLHWYVSSKMPLFDKAGAVIGIAGVMRDFERAGQAVGPYRAISPVLAYIQANYDKRISTDEMAAQVKTSTSTLERRFRKLFQMSPSNYLQRVRLHAARRLLTETEEELSVIAIECGFYDQSHFTKVFRGMYSQTPRAFRKDWKETVSRHAPGGVGKKNPTSS